MRKGSILNLNGEVVRVLSSFATEVVLEIVRTGNICIEPLTVVRRAAPTLPVPVPSDTARPKRHRRQVPYTLYLFHLGNDIYKIGITKNVQKRARSLKTGLLHHPILLERWHMPRDRAAMIEGAVKRHISRNGQCGTGGTEVFRSVTPRRAVGMVERIVQQTA